MYNSFITGLKLTLSFSFLFAVANFHTFPVAHGNIYRSLAAKQKSNQSGRNVAFPYSPKETPGATAARKKGFGSSKQLGKKGKSIGSVLKTGSTEKVEDRVEDFPNYEMIWAVSNQSVKSCNRIWQDVEDLSPDEKLDRTYINDVFWPKMLSHFRDAHIAVREMTSRILFKRKPAALMDALFKVTSLRDLQHLVRLKVKEDTDHLKIKYFELSSASHQMHRFYSKRMRDILRDDARIDLIAESILKYRSYVWNANDTQSGFSLQKIIDTPVLAKEQLLYLEGTKNVFLGIRELLEASPDVVLKAQYEGRICEDNQTLFNIEPAGLDGPYYVLFYLCLTDIKSYLLLNFARLYQTIYRAKPFTEQKKLNDQLVQSMSYRIDLFDEAFAPFTKNKGPSYQTYPGIGICDPPSSVGRTRNWKYLESFIKLTNFIKVFVAQEQSLHKAGNCKQTCDVLDGTYKPCTENDTNCILDEEIECLTNPSLCTKFNPPCPAGAYQCQNASTELTVCPSTRHDRLYEYIKGKDFYFGPAEAPCPNSTRKIEGEWKMEHDVLVDTPHFCDVCTCYCFEPMVPLLGDHSVRYINLATLRTRFKLNYIVCGIKFEQIDDQIHLRIAEGKALPNQKVDPATVEWVPIEKQMNKSLLARLDRDLRSFNLDDVVTHDPDRVVTGVKIYNAVYNGKFQYNYLGLQVLTHPIQNGQVIFETKEKGRTIKTGKTARNANSTAHRNIYKYSEEPDGPDDPLQAEGPSLPDTTSNQYLVFMGTSLAKDAAQQTIPFFDSQPLIRKEPRWLKGVGIYHKSRPGYGGFLSLKLIEHHEE